MKTYRTYYADNDRHKDLSCYISKEEFIDYLRSLTEVELAKVRQALQVPTGKRVDHYLDRFSENAVCNSAITEALYHKVDKDKISKVGITGNYKDLENKPKELPNPEALIIRGRKNYYYDGSDTVTIEIPKKISDLEGYKDLPDLSQMSEIIPIKRIYVNDKEILPDAGKKVHIVLAANDIQGLDDAIKKHITDVVNELVDARIKEQIQALKDLEIDDATPNLIL